MSYLLLYCTQTCWMHWPLPQKVLHQMCLGLEKAPRPVPTQMQSAFLCKVHSNSLNNFHVSIQSEHVQCCSENYGRFWESLLRMFINFRESKKTKNFKEGVKMLLRTWVVIFFGNLWVNVRVNLQQLQVDEVVPIDL